MAEAPEGEAKAEVVTVEEATAKAVEATEVEAMGVEKSVEDVGDSMEATMAEAPQEEERVVEDWMEVD